MPRILLVKTTSLGDVIHNLAVASDIARAVDDVHVDWVVEDSFAAIPRLHPAVDRTIPVALRRWRKHLLAPSTWKEIRAGLRDLRSTRYDYILDTQGLLKSALIARQAHGPVYGQDKQCVREPMASHLYHRRYFIARDQHAVTRNRQLASAVFGYDLAGLPLDYGIEGTSLPLTGMALPTSAYVVFLHGTSRASKLWPESSWRELGSMLQKKNLSIVLPWGNREEHERAQRLAAMPGTTVTPGMNLTELAGLLARARAVVGVDTGPSHLAVALGRPTVAIYTDTDPAYTGVLPMDPRRAINIGSRGQTPNAGAVYASLEMMVSLE